MSPGSEPAAFIGLWQLVAYEDRAAETDAWGETFGANPTGRAEYHPAGYLSIHVAAGPDTPSVAPYFGYFGTWSLREAALTAEGMEGVVEHHIIACSHPDWTEGDPARLFLVKGDELILGDRRTSQRRFTRLA